MVIKLSNYKTYGNGAGYLDKDIIKDSEINVNNEFFLLSLKIISLMEARRGWQTDEGDYGYIWLHSFKKNPKAYESYYNYVKRHGYESLLKKLKNINNKVEGFNFAYGVSEYRPKRHNGYNSAGNKTYMDGWTYRGRGMIQLTGRSNYEAMSRRSQIDLVSNPDLIITNKVVHDKVMLNYFLSRRGGLSTLKNGTLALRRNDTKMLERQLRDMRHFVTGIGKYKFNEFNTKMLSYLKNNVYTNNIFNNDNLI